MSGSVGRCLALSCALGCLSAGCSAKSEQPDEPSDGGFTPGPPVSDAGIPLPFVVDDHFHPSGCIGADGCSTVIHECDTTREITRPEGAQGQCYRFEFMPMGGFGGLFFQNQDAQGQPNWGQAEGTLVAPGATRVTFFAAAEQPGQKVKFQVGNISDDTLPYSDTLDVQQEFALGQELEPFELSLEGQSYQAVISAFSWVIEDAPAQTGVIKFFVDDVRWQ